MMKYLLIGMFLIFAYHLIKILVDLITGRGKTADYGDDGVDAHQRALDGLGTLTDPHMNDRVGGPQRIDYGRMYDVKTDDGIKPFDSDLFQRD